MEIKMETKKEATNEMSNDRETSMKEKKKFVWPYQGSAVFRKLITAWLYAAVVMYMMVPMGARGLGNLYSYDYISGTVGILTGLLIFVPLMVYPFFFKKREYLERIFLFCGFVFLATISLYSSFSAAFLGVVLVASFLLLIYTECGWDDGRKRIPLKSKNIAAKLAVITGLAFFLLVSCWTVARVKTHSTPTYDFGIFAQMFYSMKTNGTMTTTLERQETMSHLCVHVSLIYYLMLPFYFIVSTPATLQVLQAAVLTSAFYPLWKLAKEKGLNKWESLGIVAILALYPAYAGGTSYDLHENVFLTPLLLWLLYFIEKKKKVGIGVFAVLTFFVKEDAAVYVAIIALYLVVQGVIRKSDRTWKLVTGGSLMLGSIFYFIIVTSFLATFGDGVMTSRYSNFIYDGSGSLTTVIKAIILEPMKVFYEIVDKDKLPFIGMTIGALAGIPLLTRKYERYILIIPYILINLMPDYGYQSSIYMQYGYGVTACLFYLFILNYSDIKAVLPQKLGHIKKYFFIVPIVLCTIMFWNTVIPKAMTYMERYQNLRDRYTAREELMDKIPSDASVAASTFFTVYLSQRDIIYDIKHSKTENILSVDYILADYGETDCYSNFKSSEDADGYQCFKELLYQNGFVLSDISGYGLDVFVKENLR